MRMSAEQFAAVNRSELREELRALYDMEAKRRSLPEVVAEERRQQEKWQEYQSSLPSGGVKAIGVISAILGAGQAWLSVLLMLFFGFSWHGSGIRRTAGMNVFFATLFSLGIALIACGVGAFALARWAPRLAHICAWGTIIMGAIAIAYLSLHGYNGYRGVVLELSSMALFMLLDWFWRRRTVREQFDRRTGSP